MDRVENINIILHSLVVLGYEVHISMDNMGTAASITHGDFICTCHGDSPLEALVNASADVAGIIMMNLQALISPGETKSEG